MSQKKFSNFSKYIIQYEMFVIQYPLCSILDVFQNKCLKIILKKQERKISYSPNTKKK